MFEMNTFCNKVIMGMKYHCFNEGIASVFLLNLEKYFINERSILEKNLKKWKKGKIQDINGFFFLKITSAWLHQPQIFGITTSILNKNTGRPEQTRPVILGRFVLKAHCSYFASGEGGRQNTGSPRYPCPNLWNLWILYDTWGQLIKLKAELRLLISWP